MIAGRVAGSCARPVASRTALRQAARPGRPARPGLQRCAATLSDPLDNTADGNAAPAADGPAVDVVLSSGWMAFARHAGFLQAVEDTGLRINSLCGTSAGAMTGALYAAGYSPRRVAEELMRVPPIKLLKPGLPDVWNGAFIMEPAIERLRELLPATFEELDMPLVIGVVDSDGKHRLVSSGSLPEVVAASACVPKVFQPVHVPGLPNGPFVDGGAVDRVALRPWRELRASTSSDDEPELPVLVHVITRSSPYSGVDDISEEPALAVVRSPKSGFNLWDGASDVYWGQMEDSYRRAREEVAIAAKDLLAGGESSSHD
ncbi:unnamed protein product [Pedinophyceae sp. YPF-701]|nr:unnamed protein product [Pedinophyceae sp. YPF-701]